MSQDARTAFVDHVTDTVQATLLKNAVTTEQLFAKYHRPLRDVRSENLVVTALPAVTAMRFLAGSMFEFFAGLQRPAFAAGEDFFPRTEDVILVVADQDEPDIIQGLAMVRSSGERRDIEESADGAGYVSATYELVWSMVRDEDRAVKLLIAAYVAEATRKAFQQLAGRLAALSHQPKEDVAISYEYRDRVDDELYKLMADDLVLVVSELGRTQNVRSQFRQLGWLIAD